VQGTYVLFGQCAGPNGSTEIITSPVVLVSASASHVATASAHFVVASSFGTPSQRQAVDRAVQGQVAADAAGGTTSTASAGAPNGGLELSIPRLATTHHSSSNEALTAASAAAVAGLVAAGLVILRRRRSAADA
jgi:hypothetical protein